MERLTIITINRNNAAGLGKTIKSVIGQTCTDFEYVIVDGASTDNSLELISEYACLFSERIRWISEPDSGIYNAMNKGIKMAGGEYVEFLNSGDCLASDSVVEKVYDTLEKTQFPPILYGNLLKDISNGKILKDKGCAGEEITFLRFFRGTLNHPSSFIRKSLFEKYGLYDENLRIVSDWKWFLQAIVLGEEKPVYTDIDIVLFDMNGISGRNIELANTEREQVLADLFPKTILKDYERWASPIAQMKRVQRHPWAYKLVWILERVLFKIEKNKG